jgi:hypothetical protein
MQNPPDTTTGATVLSFKYLATTHHCQNLISTLSASHERRTRPVKRDGYWLLFLEYMHVLNKVKLKITYTSSLLFCIREVLSSNIGQETGYPD